MGWFSVAVGAGARPDPACAASLLTGTTNRATPARRRRDSAPAALPPEQASRASKLRTLPLAACAGRQRFDPDDLSAVADPERLGRRLGSRRDSHGRRRREAEQTSRCRVGGYVLAGVHA